MATTSSLLLTVVESNETVESLKLELARTFSALCDRLSQSTTVRTSILRMQCIDVLLRKKVCASFHDPPVSELIECSPKLSCNGTLTASYLSLQS